LKLLAVSENKTKLIGIVHYTFKPASESFEQLDRKTINFQKSIDKTSSVCFSSELKVIKQYGQQDYVEMIKSLNRRTEKHFGADFSKADNMGTDTNQSFESENSNDNGHINEIQINQNQIRNS